MVFAPFSPARFNQQPRDEIEHRLAAEEIKFPVFIGDARTGNCYGDGFAACLLNGRHGNVASI
jgi:hypothetical protein